MVQRYSPSRLLRKSSIQVYLGDALSFFISATWQRAICVAPSAALCRGEAAVVAHGGCFHSSPGKTETRALQKVFRTYIGEWRTTCATLCAAHLSSTHCPLLAHAYASCKLALSLLSLYLCMSIQNLMAYLIEST